MENGGHSEHNRRPPLLRDKILSALSRSPHTTRHDLVVYLGANPAAVTVTLRHLRADGAIIVDKAFAIE
jgi:hypothetical protein